MLGSGGARGMAAATTVERTFTLRPVGIDSDSDHDSDHVMDTNRDILSDLR